MRRLYFVLALVCSACIFQGCASTISSVSKLPLSDGEEHIFDASFQETVIAAQLTCGEFHLDIEQEYKIDNQSLIIIARRPRNLVTSGSYIRFLIIPQSEHRTLVRILSKRKDPLDFVAKDDYSEDILSKMYAMLKVNQGN